MEKMHPPKYKALEDSASKCVVTEAPPTKTLAATDLAAAGENQPEVAQASPDDEAGPAHPHWCSPATDNDWPTHVNPQEMEESHQRKNHAGHHIEYSLIHGPILQGFHRHNNGKRHEAVHLIRHSPDRCRLKTTLRLFVVIGNPGSPRTRLRRV